MDQVQKSSFTKARYIEAFSTAERVLGSVLPYGQWKDEYNTRFERMRGAVAKAYGSPEDFLALPDNVLLKPDIADAFNRLIVPLVNGEVRDKDHIMHFHVPNPDIRQDGEKHKPAYSGWKKR